MGNRPVALLHASHGSRGTSSRRRALRALTYALVVVGAIAVLRVGGPRAVGAAPSPILVPVTDRGALRTMADLRGQLDLATTELTLLRDVVAYSSRHRVSADLARDVLETARAEGLDPELAFRLVRVESGFNPRATSSVGALGLTQLMLPTARLYDRTIDRAGLFDAKRNLHIGFRYLRELIAERHGDLRLALLTYNRGAAAVQAALLEGRSPANGYAEAILSGYSGTGILPASGETRTGQ
jgi:soluble lytic murein transglycosylase-like protein